MKNMQIKKIYLFKIYSIIFLMLLQFITISQALANMNNMLEEVVYFDINAQDVNYKLEMTIFRDGNLYNMPLIIMNHGVPSDKSELSKMIRARPITQAKLFVEKGYAVAVPMRRGYAQSEGKPPAFSCDITATANEESLDIIAAVKYMNTLPYIKKDSTTLIGVSAGALASFAAASQLRETVISVINFSGGRRLRGGQSDSCYPLELLNAFSYFGEKVTVPTLWLYSPNDKVFPPELVKQNVNKFQTAGGTLDYRDIPVFNGDAHNIFSNPHAIPLWWAQVQNFMGDKSVKLQKINTQLN